MIPLLPDDVLHLICDELCERRDFGTLFACCTANRVLGDAALTRLYRTQHVAAVRENTSSEATGLAEQHLVTQRWSIRWKSVILSAVGKTVMPYVRYVRVLDLDNFNELLRDDQFRGHIMDKFFDGGLSDLKILSARAGVTREGRKRPPPLNFDAIVQAVGDLIVRKAPLLEAIHGPISSPSLLRWIPHVPFLRTLQVFEGEALQDAATSSLLKQYCPRFECCRIYRWQDPTADERLSKFLSGLPQDSIQAFVTFSRVYIGPQSCLALSGHGNSLKELSLSLEDAMLCNLGLLSGCTALRSLDLTDNDARTDLQLSQNDVFLDMVAWIRACVNLRVLLLNGFASGAAIATPVLMERHISLERLEVSNYASKDRNAFHLALPHQPNLQRLVLDADWIENRDDQEVLCYAVCELKSLRLLKLIGLSYDFSHHHVEALADNLGQLTELYVGGALGDATLRKLASLQQIRTLTLSGVTAFTKAGFADFISQLGPGHRGLQLAIDMADPDKGINEGDLNAIRAQLATAVGGRFDYTYIRDPDVSDYDSESD